MIYFIRAHDGPVKIGYSRDPRARLKALQTSHYERLRIIVDVEGDPGLENSLHAHFAHKRLSGEWFDLSNHDIAKVIDSILTGVFAYEPEPEPEDEPRISQREIARRLITELLSEANDWFPGAELEEAIISCGVCRRNVKQVRATLYREGAILKRRRGGQDGIVEWKIA